MCVSPDIVLQLSCAICWDLVAFFDSFRLLFSSEKSERGPSKKVPGLETLKITSVKSIGVASKT